MPRVRITPHLVNAAFERLTGYRAEEVLWKNCRVLTAEPSDSPERVRLRKTRFGAGIILPQTAQDGEQFWNDLTLFPVYDASGNVRNLVATQTDATERVKHLRPATRRSRWSMHRACPRMHF